jgi:hypothetical protein
MKKVTCIRCDIELENIERHRKDTVQPYDGIAFNSRGHYGSGIFDPMGEPEYLELVICDVCVMENLDKIHGTGIKNLKERFDDLMNYAKKNRDGWEHKKETE